MLSVEAVGLEGSQFADMEYKVGRNNMKLLLRMHRLMRRSLPMRNTLAALKYVE